MALTTINSGGVKDDSIVNADIKSDAAIAGSKITPAFGSQDITSSGKINIGSSTHTTRKLAIHDTTNAVIVIEGASDGSSSILLADENDEDVGSIAYNHSTDDLTLTAADNIILTGDAVGINTTSPANPLEVKTTGTSTAVFGNRVAHFRSDASGRDAHIAFGDNVNASAAIGYSNPELYFYVAGDERLRIKSDGNVGIGTVSPGQKLSINGAVDATDYRVLADNPNISFYLTSPSDWRFRTTGGAERMRIDSAGFVGIGEDNPNAYYSTDLVIGTAASGGITLASNGAHTNYFMFADGSTGSDRYAGYIGYAHATDTFVIRGCGNGTKGIDIDTNGNLNIIDGNLQVASGHGIDFSAQTGTSATGAATTSGQETLDHYEEGTWTPTFTGSTGNPTLSGQIATGLYTKIGNLVTVTYYSGSFTLSGSPGGTPYIGGLPFAAKSTGNNYATAYFSHTTCFNAGACGYVNNGGTLITVLQTGDTTAGNTWESSGTKYLMVHFTYLAA